MAIFGIKLHKYGQSYFFSGDSSLQLNDQVIVHEEERLTLGRIVHGPYTEVSYLKEEDLPLIVRKASVNDLEMVAENVNLAQDAREFCGACIRMRQLEMKLVDVEVFFDRSKMIFFFIAPTRIDFRELVKDLVRRYHTRIELRQIGVRHETQMIGALGSCGKVCCCRQYLRHFTNVSIQMAKVQHIFLNPGKLSGTCGRLLCCLAYEQENYDEFYAKSPRVGHVYTSTLGNLKVVATNMFKRQVTTLDDAANERSYSLEEWAKLNPVCLDGVGEEVEDDSLAAGMDLLAESLQSDALDAGLSPSGEAETAQEKNPRSKVPNHAPSPQWYFKPKTQTQTQPGTYFQKLNPQIPLNLPERKQGMRNQEPPLPEPEAPGFMSRGQQHFPNDLNEHAKEPPQQYNKRGAPRPRPPFYETQTIPVDLSAPDLPKDMSGYAEGKNKTLPRPPKPPRPRPQNQMPPKPRVPRPPMPPAQATLEPKARPRPPQKPINNNEPPKHLEAQRHKPPKHPEKAKIHDKQGKNYRDPEDAPRDMHKSDAKLPKNKNDAPVKPFGRANKKHQQKVNRHKES
ncbi:MAG: hypothetical protein IJU79_06405 [Desulfovibrionaceae bacterium]|nr:hypothetical protein [Desulfovibrionaceae bacterium]